MATRPTGRSDKDIFVSILSGLLQPITRDAIAEVAAWEKTLIPIATNGQDPPANVELSIEDFIKETHIRLLGKLFDLAQTDSKLSMLLIPIMAHLRKIPTDGGM